MLKERVMGKRLVTNQDEIFQLILADAAFTEAVSRDDKGVYVMGGDGSKRYITQLEMEDDL
jgi:trans-2-enoyl-CoA reductase